MSAFDSGAFDSGTFDGQPVNQISGRADFVVSVFGAAALGNIVATGDNHEAFGTANAAQVFYGVGFETSAFGLANPQWPQDRYPPSIYDDVGFGIARADLLPLGGFGSQTITVPYFTDTSVPLPLHVAAKIAVTGFTNQSFGNLTHETWKFGGSDTSRFGTTMVGVSNIVLREADTRLPVHSSLIYAFGYTTPPRIYCFGLDTRWGNHIVANKIGPTGFDTLWGAVGVGHVAVTYPIYSTRLPSAYTTLEYRFGQQDEVTPDTFIATVFGTAVVANAVTNITPVFTGRVGDHMVTRYNPPALRVRDAKNTTLKFDGVPFQFGYPKRDIFPIGVKPAVISPTHNVKGENTIQPTGFDAQQIRDWSAPWMTNYVQYVTWIFSSGYAGYPMLTGYGTPTASNGGLGIRPKGAWLGTVANTLSVANVLKSIHPYHGRVDPLSNTIDNVHTEFGTLSAAVDPNFIPAQYIRPQPFTEVFRDDDWVWSVEPRAVGPVTLGATQVGEFAFLVSKNYAYYDVQGFQDDVYGYPEVERIANIHPTNWDTLWGAPQVTHYVRSVYQWQPWKDTRFGEISFRYRTFVYPAGVPSDNEFGDVHRWEENVIRLRPWVSGEVGVVEVRALLHAIGIGPEGVGAARAVVPTYANTFWATIMGHDPTVVYATNGHMCGQLPRAVVPKGFAITQFGDFDAQL